MKIEFKLISFILAILFVPIIIINIVASNSFNKSFVSIQLDDIERSLKNQAEDINLFCERILSHTKALSSDATVRRYVSETCESGFMFDSDNEDFVETALGLKAFHNYNSIINRAVIINKNGYIVASEDMSDCGSKMADYEDVFDIAFANNGFSGFKLIDVTSGKSPVFFVAKAIYSDKNEKIGALYVEYDSIILQKYINNLKLNKYSSAAVMDSSGNVIEYPFKNVKALPDTVNYAQLAEKADALIASESDDLRLVNNMIYTDSSSNYKAYYVAPVSNSGWYLISVTDMKSLEVSANSYSNSMRWMSVLICVLLAAAVCIYITIFSKPVHDILKVFSEKQKGNMGARFDGSSKDEFGQIGYAFNSMFDNVFESEQRYRTIVEMTNNIIFEINYKKGTVYVSKNFNKKFSFRPKDDTLQESFIYKLRIHKDDKERYLADFDRILGPANFIQGEYRVKSIYGDFIWIMIKATKFYDRDEVPTKIVGVIVDIDREKKSEMHLLQRASYDNLTQLYNRETFLKSLSGELEISAVKKSLDAVMFIDLDDFKFFNDQYGHACGDEVLKFVADTLKEISFERGFAGRFGGDEFVVCFTNLTLYGDSGKIAQEIIDVLGKGFISDSTGMKLSIKCSIGIAFLRESGKSTDEVIAAADEAMYNIKKHGKSAFAYAKSKGEGQTSVNGIVAPNTSAIDSDMKPKGIAKVISNIKGNDDFYDPSL